MFDSILAPLDGSELAECVLPHIIAVARPFNAQVTVLRMLDKNQPNGSPQLFDLLNWQLNKTKAALYLEDVKKRILKSGLMVRTLVLDGLIAQGITNYAQTQGTKLIILSSHGRSGLTDVGISSVAQKIILSAPTSLLIVRANRGNIQGGGSEITPLYQHILVPLDGSQRAENVLPIITQLARYHLSRIHIVHVVQTPEMARRMPPSPEDINLYKRVIARNLEEAEDYLEQVKSYSYLESISVQTHLITGAHPAAELHQLVEQEHIDLVILNAHGYSGNNQWPYGSMVHNFILYGKTPLLVVQDLPARQEPVIIQPTSRERSGS